MMKIKFLLYLALMLLFHTTAQAALTPLHVDGRTLRDGANQAVQLRIINLDDYQEYSYDPYGDFTAITSWLHTCDDYSRIKTLGFNAVRVLMSPQHFEGAMERLLQHVQWAYEHDLYVILTYGPPPGSVASGGGYSDAAFWQCYRDRGTNCAYVQTFLDQWRSASIRLAGYANVIFEALNEPQLPADLGSTALYAEFIRQVAATLNGVNDSRLLIVGGTDYSAAGYPRFAFIPAVADAHPNMAYAFHLYMPDIAFQACNWDSPVAVVYRDKLRPFESEEPGVQTASFQFSIDEIKGDLTAPWLSMVAYSQSGQYRIESFTLKDAQGHVLLTDDFSNKELCMYDYNVHELNCNLAQGSPYCPGKDWGKCNMLLYDRGDPYKSWTVSYGGANDSAPGSRIYVENGQAVIANTVADDTTHNWANMDYIAWIDKTDWGHYDSHFLLAPGEKYTLSFRLAGQSVDDNGGLRFDFYDKNARMPPFWKEGHNRFMQNVCYGSPGCLEQRLSSDSTRIDAAVAIMEDLSNRYNAPFILDEFGIPARIPESDQSLYFRAIVDAVQRRGLAGWGNFDYREPFSNRPCSSMGGCAQYVTFALFSGWQVNVGDMDDISEQIGASEHYFRRNFAEDLAATLGGQVPALPRGSGIGAGSANSKEWVQRAYIAYYGRPADPAGLAYWANRMDLEGGSLSSIIAAFGVSDEFDRRYHGLTQSQLLDKLYQQTLGRDPDQDGKNWYLTQLVNQNTTPQTIALDLLGGAKDADAHTVANRLQVADHYTAKVAAGCCYGSEQVGVDSLATVTSDPTTVSAANAAIDQRCGN